MIGFRVWGVRLNNKGIRLKRAYRFQGLRLNGGWGLRCKVLGLGLWIYGLGFTVLDLGFRV